MKIYKITNKINNKVYIGQTKQSIQDRFIQHCNNADSVSAIAAAINKYGKENFLIEELVTVSSQEELDLLEKTLIKSHNSMAPDGYNLKTGGLEGSRYSEESKEKMSKAKLGKKTSEETKRKMSESHLESLKNPELRKRRGERYSERYASDPKLREKMSNIRKEYWSDEDNRKIASIRAKDNLDDNLRVKISLAVKSSFQNDEVKKKLKLQIEKQKKAVIRSDGVEFNSLQSAAIATNISSSSIIKQIKGKYKTAGGFTFTYKDVKSKQVKPIVYLVCGVSGSGKSWVCNQLKDKINYVSFDDVPKNEHESCLHKNSVSLYDPTFKISTFIKKNAHLFDIRPVFIIETEKTIEARLIARGGIFSDKTVNRMRSIDKRTKKYGVFSGTSLQVLNYLKDQISV